MGRKNGKGVLTFVNGEVYDGYFKDDMKHGKALLKYPSGNYYEGEWVGDKKQGTGVMHWAAQEYTGAWHNNLPHGFGTLVWLDDDKEKNIKNRYQGEWVQGQRHGYGVFYYANGSIYEGFWKHNLKDGQAVFTSHEGLVQIYSFANDKQLSAEPALAQEDNDFLAPELKISDICENRAVVLKLNNIFLRNHILLKQVQRIYARQDCGEEKNLYCSQMRLFQFWQLLRDAKYFIFSRLVTPQHGLGTLDRYFAQGVQSQFLLEQDLAFTKFKIDFLIKSSEADLSHLPELYLKSLIV